jgi:hypothetical protein
MEFQFVVLHSARDKLQSRNPADRREYSSVFEISVFPDEVVTLTHLFTLIQRDEYPTYLVRACRFWIQLDDPLEAGPRECDLV